MRTTIGSQRESSMGRCESRRVYRVANSDLDMITCQDRTIDGMWLVRLIDASPMKCH
jgi:hypothetical protein